MLSFLAYLCMSSAIYHEARGEPFDGQAMVALVIMNRAAQDPEKVCAVIHKPKQFSWFNGYHKAKSIKAKVSWFKKMLPKDRDAWLASNIVAFKALNNKLPKSIVTKVGKADHYFNPSKANPVWRHALKEVGMVGNHLLLTSR